MGCTSNYVAHDFLFAAAALTRGPGEETAATLQFSHKMNRLVLNLNVDDPEVNAKEGDAVTFILPGITTDGTFNVNSGEITPESITDKVVFTGIYGQPTSLLYIPQMKSNVELLVKIGTKYFSAVIPKLATSEDESGYSYTYTITKTRENVIVKLENTSINDWNAGEGGDIEAEEKHQETTGIPSVGDWNNGGDIELAEPNQF